MSPEPIEIRRLAEEDSQAFYQFRLEALENEPAAFSTSPEEHRAMTLDDIARRLGHSSSGSDDFVLAALVSERIVGIAGFYHERGLKSRHKGRIWGVYVTNAWRRKGIARVLLTELITRIRANPQVEQICLSVASEQTAARQLYQSLGFEIYGREPRAIKLGNHYLDEDEMLLRLAP